MKELKVERRISQNFSLPMPMRNKLVALSQEQSVPLSYLIIKALKNQYEELREDTPEPA